MRKLFWRLALSLPIVIAALLCSRAKGAEVRNVWIDTDLSIGSPWREVDDGYALLLAFHSPEVRIVGISTTYGNAPLRATTQRTRDLINRLGLTIPINPGAASPGDLGHSTAASDALASALRENKRLTYIALGPLTNFASFLTLHPLEAKRFDQIIMVAGKSPGTTLGFGPREKFRIHDANFVKDPQAVRVVLESRLPILLAPIETSSRLTMDAPDLRALKASGPPGRLLAQQSGMWLWFWTHIAQAKGGPIFDALALVAAAKPQLVTIEERSVAIDAKSGLIVSRPSEWAGRKVLFCPSFSPDTKDFILSRLRGAM